MTVLLTRDRAQELDAPTYYDGVPCEGMSHIRIKMTKTGLCVTCEREQQVRNDIPKLQEDAAALWILAHAEGERTAIREKYLKMYDIKVLQLRRLDGLEGGTIDGHLPEVSDPFDGEVFHTGRGTPYPPRPSVEVRRIEVSRLMQEAGELYLYATNPAHTFGQAIHNARNNLFDSGEHCSVEAVNANNKRHGKSNTESNQS